MSVSWSLILVFKVRKIPNIAPLCSFAFSSLKPTPNTKTKISREFFPTSENIENLNLVKIVRESVALCPADVRRERYGHNTCPVQPVGIINRKFDTNEWWQK